MDTTCSGGYAITMSPQILSFEHGKIEVEHNGFFKSCLVYHWTCCEVSIDAGIISLSQIEIMFDSLIPRADDIGMYSSSYRPTHTHMVFSTGMDNTVQVSQEVVDFMAGNNTTIFIGNTVDAVKTYNEWRKCYKVAGLFHAF